MSEISLPYCNDQTIDASRVAEIGQAVKAGFKAFAREHEDPAIRELYGGGHRMQWFADGYSTWSLVYRVEDMLYRLVTVTLVPAPDSDNEGHHIHWRVFPANYQRAGVDESDMEELRKYIGQLCESPPDRQSKPVSMDDPTTDAHGVSMGESEQQIITRYAGDFDDDE